MADGRLKEFLWRDSILVVPAAFDMVSAKIIEKTGFEAVYLSGFGQSASHLGLPDAGLMTFTEVVERVHNMAGAVHLPLLADGNTGYGGIINVRRTVQEFEWAGASAIQLEDQEIPKKCGHTGGKRIIDAREMVLKIEAAVESRRNDDFLIIARTDARSVSGLEEAIRRGKMYGEAGADIIFIESPQTEQELRDIAGSFEKPTMANMVEGGKSPLLKIDELEEMGFKIAIFPVTCLLMAARAMQRAMESLKSEGGTQGLLDEMMGFEEFNSLIGFPEIRSFEAQYSL
ncbi:MAG: carboxyvinyl-carboxyphosphonate phosphorylmutase [Deltaproteobacteria bacterium]|nr:isocitrate lyase/phosphoenolpyruvate mutase family protein [Deltaproteobacteria bacterium]MBW2312272.1 isocitrate lyase/phosphoenolpyruvate mutase family protein [Deltaproteobacteria bacterium]RLB28396.1 MAG: carboxyvinyl-carboxyphosphonate phosphorylmutase [Deltaproteobacteria bacterium]